MRTRRAARLGELDPKRHPTSLRLTERHIAQETGCRPSTLMAIANLATPRRAHFASVKLPASTTRLCQSHCRSSTAAVPLNVADSEHQTDDAPKVPLGGTHDIIEHLTQEYDGAIAWTYDQRTLLGVANIEGLPLQRYKSCGKL